MRLISFLLFFLMLPATAFACGTESRCEVDGGYYLAAVPDDWDGKTPLGLVVYFHGWNGTPEGTFRNRGMVRGATSRGAIFVAPYARTGYWRQIGKGRAEGGRDEAAYIRTVMADVRRRWPINQSKTLASGFSRGASMVWNVACYTGDLFRAYACAYIRVVIPFQPNGSAMASIGSLDCPTNPEPSGCASRSCKDFCACHCFGVIPKSVMCRLAVDENLCAEL